MKIPIILIIVFLLGSDCFAQKDIVVFTGINSRNTFTKESEYNFIDFYHNLAFNLGVGANFKADRFVLLSPTIAVDIYPFPRGIYPYIHTHDRYVESMDISKAIIYRFLIEFKIISSDKYSEQAYLLTGILSSGSYEVNWVASNYTSGVYFYKLIADNFVDTKRMLLVK